jgi:hypothetical protein
MCLAKNHSLVVMQKCSESEDVGCVSISLKIYRYLDFSLVPFRLSLWKLYSRVSLSHNAQFNIIF